MGTASRLVRVGRRTVAAMAVAAARTLVLPLDAATHGIGAG